MPQNIQERIKIGGFEDLRQEAVLQLLTTAGHYRQILRDICDSFGITHPQYNILRILKGIYPEGHPRYEIADRMLVRTPDVTRLLDRLDEQSLIYRTKSKEDKRLSIAKITDKGLDLLVEMRPHFKQASKDFCEGISNEELSTLSAICNKFYENV